MIKPITNDSPGFNSWYGIDWNRVNTTVKEYQYGIHLAKKTGDTSKLRYLQIRALRSRSVLLYSIRRVTSLNKGRETAGVDKLLYLKPESRFALFRYLSKADLRSHMPKPVRRIYIPKPGKTVKRPLGIPTIIDRVLQYRVKIALEPEWEALFEHGSYGFRPARSCHDAMIRVYKTLNSKGKTWILEGDIKGCFDNIAHAPLLKRLKGFPAIKTIEKWLKAGYLEKGRYHPTDVGTPQGGCISPLLSNIALHGMESALGISYHSRGYVKSSCPYTLVRYADDFVVMCKSEHAMFRAREILTKYLLEMGLSLSPEKTLMTDAYKKGFDFLGWTFQLFRDRRKKSGWVTLVRPSLKSCNKHTTELKKIWRSAVGNRLFLKVMHLNSVIRGWAHYHRFVNSNIVFRRLDHFNYLQAVRLIRRNHPNKGWDWLVQRYFTSSDLSGKGRLDRWVFQDPNLKLRLIKYKEYKIKEFLPIQFGRHPFIREDAVYFKSRRIKDFVSSHLNQSKVNMYGWQGGFCPVCGEELCTDGYQEPLDTHHLDSLANGGSNSYNNLMLVHNHCHKVIRKENLGRDELIRRLILTIGRNRLNILRFEDVRWGFGKNRLDIVKSHNKAGGQTPTDDKGLAVVNRDFNLEDPSY